MPALVNPAASNDVVPQGVSAEMAVQFNGNDVSANGMEKRFLGCLLDKICPHHHHDDNCCYEDSCSDSSSSCDSSGDSSSLCSSSSDNSYDPCGSNYSNNRCCDDPSSHSGSDCSYSSSSSSCSDSSSSGGDSCGFGCSSDTNCVHKRAMEVMPPIYNGSDLMLDRRETNAANGLRIPKTLLGVAAIAAVGAAALFI